MKRIGIGVIGWGFMGKTHTHVLREMPLFYPGAGFVPVLDSLCSRRLEMAREGAQLMGFAHHTDDYRELLDRDSVDVVSICTPNADHEAMALYAIERGKHIYLDKPVSTDLASAERILAAAEQRGILCQVALNNRFWPATLRARALIAEGRIGEILSFNCRYLHSGAIDPDRPVGWKQTAQGGVLLDLGSHALDMITHMIGQPEEVLCSLRQLYASRPTKQGPAERALGDDHALIQLRMAGGALGTVEASKIHTGAEDELSFEIYGTKGALRFQMMEPNYLWFFDNGRPEGAHGGERGYTRIACTARYEAPAGSFLPPKNSIGWDRAHMHCYYEFLRCVVQGSEPSPSLQDGVALQRLMDICLRSHRQRQWLRV